MTASSLVDVLIPVFNGATYLQEAIASIQVQTLTDIRLVIVDDGSTDATPALLAKVAAEDHRITVVKKPNGGIVDALNLGLSHCTAQFIARFDADDIAYLDRLQVQIDYLRMYSDCIAVGGRVDPIDASGRMIASQSEPLPIDLADPSWAPAREPYLIHPFMMTRRAAFEEVGGYRYVTNSEDSDLYWRLAERGRLHNLPVKLGKYRMHSESISSQSVVSGRIMAVCSQLGAVSALRRRRGASDLKFPKTMQAELKARSTLQEMWETASKQLEPSEAAHLCIAASAKLMELASYRPFRLERSDYEFIGSALQDSARLTLANQKEVRRYLSKAVSQFALQWGIRDAFRLSSSATFAEAMIRVSVGRTGLRTVTRGDGQQ